MKKTSNRMIRINEEIKKELANIIRAEIKDPRVDKLCTIVKVDTTGDLKFCTVYISTLIDSKREETVEGLKKAEKFIRRELARRINLRNTPELKFVLDDSIEYSVHMSGLLRKINTDDHKEDDNE